NQFGRFERVRDTYTDTRAHKHFRNVCHGNHGTADSKPRVGPRRLNPTAYLSENGTRYERAEKPLRHTRERVDKIAFAEFLGQNDKPAPTGKRAFVAVFVI